jgi:hypothetical protein
VSWHLLWKRPSRGLLAAPPPLSQPCASRAHTHTGSSASAQSRRAMASHEQHSQGLEPLLSAHPQNLAPTSFTPAHNSVPVPVAMGSGLEQQRGMQPPGGPNFFIPQPQAFTNTPQLAWSGGMFECWGALNNASVQHPRTADASWSGKGTDREWLVCCLTTHSFPFAFGCARMRIRM